MKTGRRIANPASKQLAGTYRKDRHADIVSIVPTAPTAALVQPSYLSAEAKLVWHDEVKRVAACGAGEPDSSMFARYCEMEAAFRVSIKSGILPKAALITELRRTAELLGIAGARSRLARISQPEQPSATSSPFTVRKR